MINDPIFSSVSQWAEAIRSRRISACEVLKIHLAQIDKFNSALSAINIPMQKRRWNGPSSRRSGCSRRALGPLHGVPFTLKDAHCSAGMRTTVGFPPFADHVPEEDSAVAARLKLAGGILIGKTNVAVMLEVDTSGRAESVHYASRPPFWLLGRESQAMNLFA